jgi:glycosyltransferase involved in cell wall biosynthesis
MTENQPHISIVSPVYRAAPILDELVAEIIAAVSSITPNFEIILVEDCGPDNSWEKIEENCQKDARVKGLKFSRNFGQHYAITAGLAEAKGEWVVVMDCDLQDRPDEIPNLYKKALEGFDLVYAQRVNRQDGFFKRLSSKAFYAIFSYLTDTPQDSSVANFGIYHRKVVAAILSMNDHIRYFPTMSRWVGFQSAYLPVQHSERAEGKSSYSFRKLLALAFNNMIAFSDKPLWLMVKFGALISFTALLIGIYYLVLFLLGNILEPGFTSLIVSIWLLSGIMIFMLGIVGIYVGKTFEKTKERPVYIVHKRLNLKEED